MQWCVRRSCHVFRDKLYRNMRLIHPTVVLLYVRRQPEAFHTNSVCSVTKKRYQLLAVARSPLVYQYQLHLMETERRTLH